jgi:nucleotide-binding universal stress UspA family protein
MHRILVPVKDLSPQSLRTVWFAQLFADANEAQIELLHVCDRRTPSEQIDRFEMELSKALSDSPLSVSTHIKTIAHDNVTKVILRAARSVDLVILRSFRRRTAGGLAISNVTTQVIQDLACSVVLFGEPHS